MAFVFELLHVFTISLHFCRRRGDSGEVLRHLPHPGVFPQVQEEERTRAGGQGAPQNCPLSAGKQIHTLKPGARRADPHFDSNCTPRLLCTGGPADSARHRARDPQGHLRGPDGGGGAGQRHEGARLGGVRGRHLQGKGRIRSPSLTLRQNAEKDERSVLAALGLQPPAPWTHHFQTAVHSLTWWRRQSDARSLILNDDVASATKSEKED